MKAEFKILWIRIGVLVLISIILKLALQAQWIEQYYSVNWYHSISNFQRIITGSLPLAIGDVLYAVAFIYVLFLLFAFIKAIVTRRLTKRYFFLKLSYIIQFLVGSYIVFNLLWGLNYKRLGIAHQLQLQLQPALYGLNELRTLTAELIQKMNVLRTNLGKQYVYPGDEVVFKKTDIAYQMAQKSLPFLRYEHPSIKKSLYGKMGNVFGFMGYYNPFTGEANVNTQIPKVYMSVVTCHEAAHQLGYASESEANFVGYLAAKYSGDVALQYSAYFDLFNYANNELYLLDSTAAKNNYTLLDTLVKLDIQAVRRYHKSNKNVLEPYVRFMYSSFLRWNNQPKGIQSYNEVIGWLMAYRKKYGTI